MISVNRSNSIQHIRNTVALMKQLEELCKARIEELSAAEQPYQSKINASMKRKSMDLTNALVALRRLSIWG